MIPTLSDENVEHIHKSQPLTRLILIGLLAYFLSIPVLGQGISTNNALLIFGWFYFVILIEAVLAICAIQLARQGPAAYSPVLAWTGVFLIAAAIWSDVLATVYHSPDLMREGNPIIIFLRENGLPLWFQYAAGFTAQFLLTVISCALWFAFARHLSLYREILLAMRPQSLVEFVWALLGGRTYFSKTERLKVSRSYRLLWWLMLPLIMPFDRFLLALEWMKGIPLASLMTQLVTFGQPIFSLVLLLSWLMYVYFENRASLRNDPALTRRANQAILKKFAAGCSMLVIGTCALACLFGLTYLWATREPEYLEARIEYVPETITANTPFPITFVIENIGAKEAAVSKVQATVWEPEGKVVSGKLLFVLANPPALVNAYGPQTILDYENIMLSPGETLQVELWFTAIEPGDALLKTSIYSGWREKRTESIPITIISP